MKVYTGAPAAARCYVEADRGRADDYYLTEGTGVARRFTASDGRVSELAPLTGEAYETWVAGRDPATGPPRGQLRTDAHAVRFVEVVINGPKSWSIAAALHPDVAAAYEAAQDRAAEQILGWVSQHATTRVGPRGGQVPVPVQVLEAATVRHYTSRANDPHWHLHLQINSRVFAAGKWRGLWTVDVRDSLAAINGIGHAAMATDPQFRAALAAHGYRLGATGEILELAEYVPPFSARNAQISSNLDRYERDWTAACPGERPGPVLRRAWDARAWAEGRPDKVRPRPGTDIGERWRTELHLLGYQPPDRPVGLVPAPVGALDRDELVDRALSRLAAARSAWNPADVRGELERLIAAAGIVTEPAVRIELAEDLTARALAQCVALQDRDGIPEHIRAWTSAPVLAVEAELTARLATRATQRSPDVLAPELTARPADPAPPLLEGRPGAGRLDPEQAAAATALAGNRPLVVLEGAAGAGKTTTLAATRALIEEQGRRLVVVTPTKKAARVAQAEVGTAARSAAWLAHQHGWRWNDDGRWTRLAVGQVDPVTGRPYTGPNAQARLRPGDLLVIDEAGMCDQDTTLALLTIADECSVRVALLGDRHQLPAVGRGGVLDLAVGQVDADAYLTLQGLHRFTRVTETGRTVPDVDYADLTLAMRTGRDPGTVFDALSARGQIRIHPDPDALRQALAGIAAEAAAQGRQVAVVADTREQVAELNAAIRDRLVSAGRVDQLRAVVTGAGQWIGVGDRVITRRNDPHLDVANRDMWVVTAVGRTGALAVTPADTPAASGRDAVTPAVTPGRAGPRVLPADYVTAHVELGYATTAHGAQGETVTAAHLVVGESTGAAAAYVAMTRGRQANTAHLLADNIADAREQWLAAFARDRADLGPAHAAQLAAAEAASYAPARPLDDVLAELHAAWADEQRCREALARHQLHREALRARAEAHAASTQRLAALQAACAQAATDATAARARAEASGATVAADTDRIRDTLLQRWTTERHDARRAAQRILDGPGRLGLRRGAVARAGEQLTGWHATWAPHLPDVPTDHAGLIRLAAGDDDPQTVRTALHAAARRAAEAAHPGHAGLTAAAQAAERAHDAAHRELQRAHTDHENRYGATGRADYTRQLAETERALAVTGRQLTEVRVRISTLQNDPALRAQPPERLQQEIQAWRARPGAAARRRPPPAAAQPAVRSPRPEEPRLYARLHAHSRGRGIGR